MFVALPVEIKSRELDSRLYIASKLAAAGISCVIGQKAMVNKYCYETRKPFVYIAKSSSLNAYQKIKKSGGKFLILDEEGGVYFKDHESTLALRNPDQVMKEVDLYLSWGAVQKDFLFKERKSIAAAKVVVTGNPRFDLAKNSFTDFHHSGLVSCEPGYILVSTRFKRFNHQLGDDGLSRFADHMRKNKATHMKKSKLYATDRVKNERDYQAELFNHFIKALTKLAETFPDQKIVIRSHPAENEETYKNLFSTYENILVSRKGSIFEWLAGAKLVIHHDCTTGLEAMFYDLPTISYTPILDEDIIQWLPVMAGYRISNFETLLCNIREHVIELYNPSFFTDRYDMSLVKSFIANTDFDSAQVIVDTLKEKMIKWGREPQIFQEPEAVEKPGIFYRIIKKFETLKNRFEQNFGDKKQVKILKKNKFNGLDITEVEEKLLLLNKISLETLQPFVERVGENTFLIQRKTN